MSDRDTELKGLVIFLLFFVLQIFTSTITIHVSFGEP